MPSSLATNVGAAADRALAALRGASAFAKVRAPDGLSLRRYFAVDAATEREICLYKDKWWNRDGGTVHVELSCLVIELQHVLAGVGQSLLQPDFAKPFHHFQFGLDGTPHAQWKIMSPGDAADFQAQFESWITATALPWFAHFASREGTLAYLRARQRHVDLALYAQHLGLAADAKQAVADFLRTLPPRAERSLARLVSARLLSEAEERALAFASMQREEEYREQVEAWLAANGI